MSLLASFVFVLAILVCLYFRHGVHWLCVARAALYSMHHCRVLCSCVCGGLQHTFMAACKQI